MKTCLSAEEMKLCDSNTMQHYGVPSCVLMERAALEFVRSLHKEKADLSRVLVVCGSGNNGGDGMAAARMLFLEHFQVDVVMIGNPQKASEEASRQMGILEKYGIPLFDKLPEGKSYTCIVDAIFGTGLSRPIEGRYAQCIRELNEMEGYKAAVDIASGVSADTGDILGCAFHADLTVTMAFAKYGQLLYPGKAQTGKLIVAQIGITPESFLDLHPQGVYYEEDDLKALLPKRREDSNKGTYGKVLSVTGSYDMAGASFLSSSAAYAAGAGLVSILSPEANRVPLQTLLPEAVLKSYEGDGTRELEEILPKATSIVCGCGLGTSEEASSLLEALLQEASAPMVLDADALNLMAEDDLLADEACGFQGQLVLTPHLGEAARLLHTDIASVQEDKIGSARKISQQFQAVCVLKDASTVCCDTEGRLFINTSGCSAMSKGGSGDVLAGTVAGLLAQGMDEWSAATCAVYLHGKAGEYMEKETGAHGLFARELVRGIREMIKETAEC